MDAETHNGGCLCGAVRYRLTGPLVYSGNCHCRSCQKATGAGFVTWSGVKQAQFEVTKGALKTCETSPGVERGFCGTCGSSLTYVNEAGWPGLISVTSVSLDDPSIAEPTVHVYTSHQQPFVKLDDGLKTFPEF